MSRERIRIYDEEELQTWLRPSALTLLDKYQSRFENGCAALHAVLRGELSLTRAAGANGLCRKRLRAMVERAPQIASDGLPYGYRVCVPWGAYCKVLASAQSPSMPTRAEPHAMTSVLSAQPSIAAWVDDYDTPLPPGRAPRSFDRLHAKVVAELKRLDLHQCYPLNQPDRGRRALIRHLRHRRIETSPLPTLDTEAAAPTALSDIFRGRPFARTETDGHRMDIEALLSVQTPNGAEVRKPITALWFLADIECESRAITSWLLRVGRNYNNLDLSLCVARGLQPWKRRELSIPGLEYAPGAGMPAGLPAPTNGRRGILRALDNHKGHHALDFEQAYCRAHDGVLHFGRPHEPRTRPIIEQLYSRLEKGAFRAIPGGFEPATRLGEDKLKISNFSPEDYPVQLHLLEELIDVIVANYNATPHPALGNLSPVQYLQMQSGDRHFFYQPPDGADCAAEMGSVLVPVVIKGNRKAGVMPHVNYAYARYRSAELDGCWELIGKTLIARVVRQDLRTIVLYRTATKPLGMLRANRPWEQTRHDETTRKLIYQWSRQPGGLSIVGVSCAVTAYLNFLRKEAKNSQQAVDQLARMQQHTPTLSTTAQPPSLMDTPLRMPRRGWVSLDKPRSA